MVGVPALAARLAVLGDLPRDAAPQSGTAYGPELMAAVKRFQDRHALEPDGVIGAGTVPALNVPLASRVHQIRARARRERWLPDTRTKPHVFVERAALPPVGGLHDPARPDEPLRMNVVVGKSMGHATPVFIEEMKYVVLSRSWNLPMSIVRNEVVPKARKDAGYLDRQNMEIIASGASNAPSLPATPENLSRVLAGKLFIRQKPGPTNSLGRAKFIFPNADSIYMHGTPAQQLFSRARRDFSHGCIRPRRSGGARRMGPARHSRLDSGAYRRGDVRHHRAAGEHQAEPDRDAVLRHRVRELERRRLLLRRLLRARREAREGHHAGVSVSAIGIEPVSAG